MLHQKDKILLVKCESNWADEFDIEGFALYTEAAWKEYLKSVKLKIFHQKRDHTDEYGPHIANIGTNEQQGYEDFSSFKNEFKTQKISEEDARIIRFHFKLTINNDPNKEPDAFGMFIYLDPEYEE